MNYHAENSDGKHYGSSNVTIVISIICVILSIVVSFGIYYEWKQHLKSEKKQYPESGKKKSLEPEKKKFFNLGKGISLHRERELSRIKQQAFLVRMEEIISKSRNTPEYAVEKAFFLYKNYFSTQENLSDISFQDILSRYFSMDLPPARESEEEIRSYIETDLLPKKFPVSMGEYKFWLCSKKRLIF